MVGFVDIGEERCDDKNDPELATHCLQFYVRSIMSDYSRPLMYCPTRNLDSHNLTSTVWEAIAALQSCGMIVICLIADGLSTNRKMFEQMRNLDNCPHQCVNIYNPEIPLFLIVDPPHLLKTTRNCIYASRPTGSRLLKYDEYYILWSHFTKISYLYETADLRCCKLTDAHFNTSSYAKMRVIYVPQLLSHSVNRLMIARGGEEMTRSAWIAGLFN